MKYGKQIKRESPPIRSFEGGIGKGKPYEGVNTIKEMGRSIHEIPRQEQSGQDMCKTPDLSDRRVIDGSMSQVRRLKRVLKGLLKIFCMDSSYYCYSLDLFFEYIPVTVSLILGLYLYHPPFFICVKSQKIMNKVTSDIDAVLVTDVLFLSFTRFTLSTSLLSSTMSSP